MPEDIDKNYVERYIKRAEKTTSEKERDNCLYRAGTHMEVIPCNGNDHLTPKQKQAILDAASKVLGRTDGD